MALRAKKEYRHFNIKTVIGPNDFQSMKEIVGREVQETIGRKLCLARFNYSGWGQRAVKLRSRKH